MNIFADLFDRTRIEDCCSGGREGGGDESRGGWSSGSGAVARAPRGGSSARGGPPLVLLVGWGDFWYWCVGEFVVRLLVRVRGEEGG
jgi:hypothetical protein